MRGVEIVLMGLYSALHNGTNYTDDKPWANDSSNSIDNIDVSNATRPLPPRIPMPAEIRVTTWQNMPYSGYKKNKNGTYVGIGYAFEILRLIQTKVDFNYTIVPPKNEILGNKTTGVMKQLFNKEVDMAVAFIPITSEFRNICSFSGIVDEVEITFMMKRLRESAIGSGLLAPFNDTVWYCILVSLIIVGPVIYVIVYMRTRISEDRGEGFPLSTCIWFTYGALLKQGSTITPVTDSTRVLFATWWIFITILTSFYTANLTAFLTLSEFTLPFNSIENIVDKRQKWVTFADHALQNLLSEAEADPKLKLLDQAMKIRKEGSYIYSSKDEDLKTDFAIVESNVTKAGTPLFIGDKHFMKDLIFHDYRGRAARRYEESGRCNLVMQPVNLYVNKRAFAYPFNSTIAGYIDKQLKILVETGIVEHLKKMKLPSVDYCPLNLKSTERRLRNTDLKLTYWCVGTGYTLAAVAFIGELISRIAQLRKACSCKSCCVRPRKIKTTELPVYKHDPRPSFLKENAFTMKSPHDGKMAQKQMINGRDYWVIRELDGDRRLVPIRSPSAMLFYP